MQTSTQQGTSSVFTPAEIAYLQSQRLGRLATVGLDRQPHVVPVGFRYNPELDTIEIGGHGFAKRKKYRDVHHNPLVAFLVDDVPSVDPWRARGIEIRGAAALLESGGTAIMPGFDPEMFRITPQRIISWGIETDGRCISSSLHAWKELAMATPAQDAIVKALLQRHGRTFADELGIDLHSNTPAPLFHLLCAALLFSARIRASTAAAAAKALAEQGWTTPHKLVEATWEQRTRVLNRAGYARYDERTATMLGDTAQLLIDRYAGDLRNLRAAAERRPEQERVLLKQFKGIGDVGADIFLREVQAVWDEVRPFVDRRARAGAKTLGLPIDPDALARLVGDRDFPRLVAALVRVQLAEDADAVLAHARQAEA